MSFFCPDYSFDMGNDENIKYYYFGIGLMSGYLINKYQTKLLYNAYKYYVIASEKYKSIRLKYRKRSNTMVLDTRIKPIYLRNDNTYLPNGNLIDIGFQQNQIHQNVFDVLHKQNIPHIPLKVLSHTFYPFINVVVIPVYCYQYNDRIIYSQIEQEPHQALSKEDLIISAHFKYKGVSTVDITSQLNSILAADGIFNFVNEMKLVWSYYWDNTKKSMPKMNDILMEDISLEFMPSDTFMVTELKNGIIQRLPNDKLEITEI